MKTSLVVSLIAVASGLSGCTKDKGPQPEPSLMNPMAPRLEFVSLTPSVIKEYRDSLTFTIAYHDSDGDLGENDPSVNNLFLIDNRINITYPFRISQLAPDNANITIRGTLNVVLPNTGITDGSTSQKATYSIYVKDRAGNQSNTVTSTEVTITQ